MSKPLPKYSEVVRYAAMLVEKGQSVGGCWAIELAYMTLAGRKNAPIELVEAFEECFDPEDRIYWWPKRPQCGARIIGLCLLAAILESEGN